MPFRRGVVVASLFGAVVLGAGACGSGDDALSRQQFERGVVERHAITADQASCVTDYVYDSYSEAEIELLYDSSIRELPSARWSPYMGALVACSLHDELLGS